MQIWIVALASNWNKIRQSFLRSRVFLSTRLVLVNYNTAVHFKTFENTKHTYVFTVTMQPCKHLHISDETYSKSTCHNSQPHAWRIIMNTYTEVIPNVLWEERRYGRFLYELSLKWTEITDLQQQQV